MPASTTMRNSGGRSASALQIAKSRSLDLSARRGPRDLVSRTSRRLGRCRCRWEAAGSAQNERPGQHRAAWLLLPRSSSHALTTAIGVIQQRPEARRRVLSRSRCYQTGRLLWRRSTRPGRTASARRRTIAFAQKGPSQQTPPADRIRRQAIVPRRPGRRSLSSPARRAAGYRFGDKALAQTEPELRCRGRSHPPSSRAS
jgi:hypothetical protein